MKCVDILTLCVFFPALQQQKNYKKKYDYNSKITCLLTMYYKIYETYETTNRSRNILKMKPNIKN